MPSETQIEWPQGQPLFEVNWRGISESLAGNGVIGNTDLEVTATATNMEIQVASGDALYTGTKHTLASADTHTLTAADANDDRWDTVYFDTATDSSGVRDGTAASNPVPPDIQGDEILLAIVYVPAGATDVPDSDILNWRTPEQQAGHIRVIDSSGHFSNSDVESVLDELASPDVDEYSSSLSGVVQGMDSGNVYSTTIPDGGTLRILQAGLMLSDGQAAPSGLDLVIATLDGAGGGTRQSIVIQGDGALKLDQTGSPLDSYTNNSGGSQEVAIMIDNGFFNSGTGSDKDAYATVRGEVV